MLPVTQVANLMLNNKPINQISRQENDTEAAV
jgi:hypothetical protein